MRQLTQGSLFTGILGFEQGLGEHFAPSWCAEVDKFCNKIIALRAPGVPNLGDVTTIQRPESVDVISFGSPCQDLSVAGRRAGLDGARSGLFFEAARIINQCRPAFAIWENVPGAFSSDAGRDLWMVLYTLRELGANDVAWRVFDSQYAGVPQHRRRIYLVADFRGRRAGEILFDPEGCGGHPAPFGAEEQELAPTLAAGANRTGGDRWPGGDADTAHTLDTLSTQAVAVFQQSSQSGRGTIGYRQNGIARPAKTQSDGQMVVFDERQVTSKGNRGQGIRDRSGTLNGAGLMSVITTRGRPGGSVDDVREDGIANALSNPGQGGRTSNRTVFTGSTIRRFTPLECERLQGFPDGWTCLCLPLEAWAHDPAVAMSLCKCPDGPRYRALGNAVTANVPRWLASRLAACL